MLYAAESESLKKSSWPRCDALAAQLAAKGPSSVDALEAASKSNTRHVRTAVLRNLHQLDQERARKLAHTLISDRAFEVRAAAAVILGIPVSAVTLT